MPARAGLPPGAAGTIGKLGRLVGLPALAAFLTLACTVVELEFTILRMTILYIVKAQSRVANPVMAAIARVPA